MLLDVSKPGEPTPLDLTQFESLDAAVAAVIPGRQYEDVAAQVLERNGAGVTELTVFFMSAVSRARSLHEGVATAIAASNPHAAFPLIRQFAETVAVVLYVADHPEYVAALMDHPKNLPKNVKRLSIQALVNYMDSRHSEQFGVVYADLCEITHFGSFAVWSPFQLKDDPAAPGRLSWASGPRWKDERQGLIACAQTVELADAMEQAIKNLGAACIREMDSAPDEGRTDG
jgi:hypothetical protein